MRRIASIIAACTVLLAAVIVCAAAPAPPTKATAATGSAGASKSAASATPTAKAPTPVLIAWRPLSAKYDMAAALKEAAGAQCSVMIFFTADWCQPCRLMDAGTFTKRGVAQYINKNFVPIRIDDSKDTSPVTTRYSVTAYPSVLFIGPGDDPLHMVVGPRPAAEFYPILQQVEALPRLMDAQRKKPDDLEANFAIGNAFATLEHLKRAEPYLKRAVELARKAGGSPRLSQAALLAATAPLEDGDADQVIRNVDQWLIEFRTAPEAPLAIFMEGTIRFKEGKYELARSYFDRIRKEFPKSPKAFEADQAIETIDGILKSKAGATSPTPTAAAPRL